MPNNEKDIIDADLENKISSDSRRELGFITKNKPKEQRTNWFHITTHTLAVSIILVFLWGILVVIYLQKPEIIPDYFIAMASTVVGFYFGNYLKNNN